MYKIELWLFYLFPVFRHYMARFMEKVPEAVAVHVAKEESVVTAVCGCVYAAAVCWQGRQPLHAHHVQAYR